MITEFSIFEKNEILFNFKKSEETEEDKYIKKFIGFDFEYDIDFDNSYSDFSIKLNDNDFREKVYYGEGIFSFIVSLTSTYSNYNYEIDEYEFNYLHKYVDNECESMLNRLLELLDIKKDLDDEILQDVFYFLDKTEYFSSDPILWEFSEQATNAVKDNAKKMMKELPFDATFEYGSKWDYELDFNIDDILEYIKKNKLDNINTISDLIESIDFGDWDDWGEIELNYMNFDYKFDYSDLNKETKKQLKSIIKALDEGMKEPEYINPNQLNLFQDVNDEVIQKVIKHNPKNYNYQYNVFKDMEYDSRAKYIGGKIYAWFKSYEYQKNFISKAKDEDDMLKKYNELESEKLLHPAIEYEYEVLKSTTKFNL